ASDRQARPYAPWIGEQLAALHGHAVAQRGQLRPAAGAAVVGHLDEHVVAAAAHAHARTAGAGLLERRAERLLDDAVRGQVDAGTGLAPSAWATTSCSSRAMRSRSASTARCARSARPRAASAARARSCRCRSARLRRTQPTSIGPQTNVSDHTATSTVVSFWL